MERFSVSTWSPLSKWIPLLLSSVSYRIGRLVVDQPVVGDRLAVGVGEHRLAEDLAGVACRGGRETDAHGVEVVEHATVG